MESFALLRRFRIAPTAILAIVLLCAIGSRVDAQTYRFRTFGIDEGLGNLAVTCVTQDATGYIWVGTLNGLYRYDGERFRRFGRGEGLAESEIVSVAPSADGSLWAVTTSGVAVFRDGQFRSVAFGREVNFRGSASIAVEKKTGAVWIATGVGIAVVTSSAANQNPPRARFLDWVPHTEFLGVAFGDDGSVWFAGSQKLYQYQSGSLTRKGSRSGVPDDDWQAILTDRFGCIWLRSPTKLLALERGSERFVDRSAGLPAAEFGALGIEANGQIAVPTTQGLARREHNSWLVIGSRSGLNMDSVSAVFVDREGSPWIGTNGGGVARWLGFASWENWTAPFWVDNDATWSFLEDKGGQIWAGTNTGILLFPRPSGGQGSGPVTRFHLKSDVRALALGLDGEIWAGTSHDGVFRCSISKRTCQSFGAAKGLPPEAIDSLLLDRKGNLWVASESGLFTGDISRRFVTFRKQEFPGEPLDQRFRQIAENGKGEILVAGNQGLICWNGRKWTHLTKADGLLDDDLGQVSVANDGSLWISYFRDLGVSHLQEHPGGVKEWKHFDQKGVLGSNYVYSLGIDKRQRIWVGTDRGIDSLDGSTWRHYGTDDGLIWPDLNTAALFGDSRGGLWFGTSRGIAHLLATPRAIRSVPPVPIVSQVQVNGREQDSTKPIAVPYLDNEITVRFSSLSFAESSRIRYKYRIAGLQNGWRTGQDRNVHLLHLPPGTYDFALAANTPGGKTSPKMAMLRFVVETPWWRTKLFIAFFCCALLGMIRGFWVWRMRGLIRRERVLEAAVAERTQALTVEKSKLMQAREAFAYQAHHDGLTKLANRSLLNEFLRDLIKRGKNATLLWIDLDRFKAVNDLFGHQMGDLLLQATAGRLKEHAGPEDLVARIGGDEFVLVLTQGTEAEACSLADRILEKLVQPFEIRNQTLVIGASLGVARFPEHGDDPELLLKNADMAMYNAKKAGKGSYKVFTSGLAADSARLAEIERQLNGILERDELYLVYQPQVDPNGRVEAVEALIRWSNPILGTVPPSSFIPIAEETGTIVAIGEWVLRTACEQGAAWHREGARLRIAVNVSVVQLARPDFASKVASILAASKFDPAYLEVEITETAVMQNAAECIRQMNELRRLNIRIAVDDFGTGNSSLSYLRMLPVDTLKIDRCFVNSLESREEHQSYMIRGVVGLAHGLRLRVIAEGVETEYQAEILREIGCESMQGYLFSRPLRADAVLKCLAPNNPGSADWDQAPQPTPTSTRVV